MSETANRERWLAAAVDLLRPLFAEHGHVVPPVRVSCGWPAVGATRKKNRRVGECWKTEAAADGVNAVFVSPYMDTAIDVATGTGVLEVLTHELCHAVDDGESGHKGEFRRIATSVGLSGKMTSTVAGPELMARFLEIEQELGPYPHARLDLDRREDKQTTRMLKLECPGCGYLARTTQKWVDTGLPTCPCGTEMQQEVKAA